MNIKQMTKLMTSAVAICSVTACTFFEEPLDDIGVPDSSSGRVPATQSNSPGTLPGSLPPPPPPPANLPTLDSLNSPDATLVAADGNYLTVATIFDVPDQAANLSFVHFTRRDNRRESELCQALLQSYPITRPADIPSNAVNVIVWPVTEGSTASECSSMVDTHEPLELSEANAAVVSSRSTGPFGLSRNSAQGRQMIYDFSAVRSGSLGAALNEWQKVLNSDVRNWPPVVKAR